MLLSKTLRPDLLLPAAHQFAGAVFNQSLLESETSDLATLVHKEAQPRTPIVLSSPPGHDASYRVEQLAKNSKTQCVSVALGSQEAFASAEQAIGFASRSGHWVLLKNCHVSVLPPENHEASLTSSLACSNLADIGREESDRIDP